MPWYAAGTITVAASGTTATGSGTAFLGNVRVGDGIAIQGSSSLHEVTGVTSDTQLTFAPPYAGAAGGGKAYRVAPVLGYDKDLSDAFNALRLQFGDQLSSLSPWATAASGGEAMDEMGFGATGKSVAAATTPAEALDELGFGTTGKALAETSTTAEARVALELGDAAIADVVGTMASGAIIERGSNADGEYVMLSDGTLFCTRTFPTAFVSSTGIGNIFQSGEVNWTFPKGFISANAAISANVRSANPVWANGRVTSSTTGAIRVFSATSSAASLTVDAFAVGKWK